MFPHYITPLRSARSRESRKPPCEFPHILASVSGQAPDRAMRGIVCVTWEWLEIGWPRWAGSGGVSLWPQTHLSSCWGFSKAEMSACSKYGGIVYTRIEYLWCAWTKAEPEEMSRWFYTQIFELSFVDTHGSLPSREHLPGMCVPVTRLADAFIQKA